MSARRIVGAVSNLIERDFINLRTSSWNLVRCQVLFVRSLLTYVSKDLHFSGFEVQTRVQYHRNEIKMIFQDGVTTKKKEEEKQGASTRITLITKHAARCTVGIGWEGTWEFTATPCSSKNRIERDVPRRGGGGRKEKESRKYFSRE